MAERVHPIPPSTAEAPLLSNEPFSGEEHVPLSPGPKSHFEAGEPSGSCSSSAFNLPPPSFVFSVPKDLVIKTPPAGNAKRFNRLNRKRRPCSLCRIVCWFIGLFLLLASAIVVAGTVLYIVYRPKIPSYSIDSLSAKGFTDANALVISPEFDVSVRVVNPNKKIGIFYQAGSDISVSYSDVRLVSGGMPAFYQGPLNATAFLMELTGSDIHVSSAIHRTLIQQQKDGHVPLIVSIKIPVRLKVGSAKTWRFAVKATCDVVVDKLTADSKIVNKHCKYSVNL